MGALDACLRRYLDHYAVDDSGQPRDRVSIRTIEYSVYECDSTGKQGLAFEPWIKPGDKTGHR